MLGRRAVVRRHQQRYRLSDQLACYECVNHGVASRVADSHSRATAAHADTLPSHVMS
ncbi:hypothetical protein AWB68_05011 [Caballeronia choica]|uniref:Uncharacterized protein n=1 Tax=Caballeronia choica TaxID=326476 RepID=A0A158K5Y2_9BURK|nr:hypothetical protein AWB68_05011 [Caballeronia choica]